MIIGYYSFLVLYRIELKTFLNQLFYYKFFLRSSALKIILKYTVLLYIILNEDIMLLVTASALIPT